MRDDVTPKQAPAQGAEPLETDDSDELSSEEEQCDDNENEASDGEDEEGYETDEGPTPEESEPEDSDSDNGDASDEESSSSMRLGCILPPEPPTRPSPVPAPATGPAFHSFKAEEDRLIKNADRILSQTLAGIEAERQVLASELGTSISSFALRFLIDEVLPFCFPSADANTYPTACSSSLCPPIMDPATKFDQYHEQGA
jgi:hypothetical protein